MVKKLNNVGVAIGIVMSFIVAILAVGRYADGDMWFLLATGREIFENGIPYENPFTYIQGLDIVVQQRVWCVVLWKIYDIFGGIGLYVFSLLIYVLVVFMFVNIGEVIGTSKSFMFAVTSFMFVLVGTVFVTVRPSIFTVFLLLCQVYVLEKYKRGSDWKILLWLVLISFVEINVHASIWFMHFVFLIPYVFPTIKSPLVQFEERTYLVKRILLITIPMALVGFLNPYGLDGIMYIFNSYNDDLKNMGILELNPPTMNEIWGWCIWIPWLIVAYYVFRDKEKKWDSSIIYLFCGLSIVGILHIRDYLFFLVGFLIMVAYLVRDKDLNVYVRKFQFVIPLTLLIVLGVVVSKLPDVSKGVEVEDSYKTPLKAIKYLEDNNALDNNIFTEFDNGSYLEFKGCNIFIDARPELYTKKLNGSKDILKDYMKYMYSIDEKGYQEMIDKYKFDYLCILDGSGFFMYMSHSDEYEKVVDGEGYYLYKKM